MSERQRFFTIEIKVPVPDSRAQQNKIITGFETELEALYAKLPADATKRDWVTSPRSGETGSRKTMQERIDEKVAEELEKRLQSAPPAAPASGPRHAA